MGTYAFCAVHLILRLVYSIGVHTSFLWYALFYPANCHKPCNMGAATSDLADPGDLPRVRYVQPSKDAAGNTLTWNGVKKLRVSHESPENPIEFHQIEISGVDGINYALKENGGTAAQSSNAYPPDTPWGHASCVIDGDRYGYFNRTACLPNGWLDVTLSEPRWIESFAIFNSGFDVCLCKWPLGSALRPREPSGLRASDFRGGHIPFWSQPAMCLEVYQRGVQSGDAKIDLGQLRRCNQGAAVRSIKICIGEGDHQWVPDFVWETFHNIPIRQRQCKLALLQFQFWIIHLLKS